MEIREYHVATDIFLRLNEDYISCKSEDTNQFFITNLEAGTLNFEIIKSWLKSKIKKIT